MDDDFEYLDEDEPFASDSVSEKYIELESHYGEVIDILKDDDYIIFNTPIIVINIRIYSFLVKFDNTKIYVSFESAPKNLIEDFLLLRINKDLEFLNYKDSSDELTKFITQEILYFHTEDMVARSSSEMLTKKINLSDEIKKYNDRIKVFMKAKNDLEKIYLICKNAINTLNTNCFYCGCKLFSNNVPWFCDNKLCKHKINESMFELVYRFIDYYSYQNIMIPIILMQKLMTNKNREKIIEPLPCFVNNMKELEDIIDSMPKIEFPIQPCIDYKSYFPDSIIVKKTLLWIILNMNHYCNHVDYIDAPINYNVSKNYVIRINECECEREKYFQEKKSEYGSEYFFHGSAMANWYSIIKHGLINMSNKDTFMVNGAVHGSGIYLSKKYDVANGYKKDGFVGVCEVINGQAKNAHSSYSDIHTLVDDKMIRVRYLIK